MKVLTPLQKDLLNILPNVAENELFYLTGGTALAAFYLEHRKSHDLDFFTDKENNSTLIHLAQDAPFRFEATKFFPDFPRVRIDSLPDIASNKLLALFQRATLRDFIDIYFLIKEDHFKKEALIKLASEKDPGFDLYWLGVAFERINLFSKNEADMLLLLKSCSLEEMVSFFNGWREEISKTLK